MPYYGYDYGMAFEDAMCSFNTYEAAIMASFGTSHSEPNGLTFMHPSNGDKKWNATGRRFRTWCYLVGKPSLPAECKDMNAVEAYEYSCNKGMLEDYRNLQLSYLHPGRDAELHPALQDLGWMIGYDLTLASAALDDPNIYYPGVDEGIEPIDDEHVRLVAWATQRELDRELRTKKGGAWEDRRPAVPIAELPFRIQRAFAERRRLRYQEWGITPETWATGKWHLLGVQEDSDWLPPWLT